MKFPKLASDRIDAGLMRKLSTAFKAWERREVPASIYKEQLLPQRFRQPDLAWESQAAEARALAEPAVRAVLEPLVAEHFVSGQKILEVGAGSLTGGRSYLSRFFGRVPQLSWTVTDNGAVAQRAGAVELDLTGAGVAPGAPHDAAVASNVFDTLPYADFVAALATVRRSVKPGGLFLHVADLNFYVNAFLDACGVAGNVLFPGAEPHKMVHALSKDVFVDQLERTKTSFNADERKFLALWAKQDAQVQAVVIGDAFLTKTDMGSLSRRVESVFGPHLTPLKQIGVFQRSLVSAAARSGWSLVECGFRVAEVTVARRPSPHGFNAYALDEGTVTGAQDPAVPVGMERVRAKVHVFLARSGILPSR